MNRGWEPGNLIRGRWLGLSVAVVANCFLSLLLVIAACLRETPEFWRNSGGYSVFLRDTVFWLFYPAAMVGVTGLAAGTWASLKWMQQDKRAGVWLFTLCALQALGLGASLVIALGNNLYNLLEGLPLHQHG